ncbi:uncharacterized protein LAJ45_07848 [Morchella importuna]|uniref:uncharacterized protein n=1 Tax=Morchella importuna TaxID=1174673 RepID=UPI001E8E8A13|nr:uncharacterized protein LAJ45_07848 [Morchella importuna]KAH8148084.1 hypothetical protein LAJ45_07848 [Morchella importuna]
MFYLTQTPLYSLLLLAILQLLDITPSLPACLPACLLSASCLLPVSPSRLPPTTHSPSLPSLPSPGLPPKHPPPTPSHAITTTPPPLTATTASPSPARRHPPAPYAHPRRHSQQQYQQHRTLHLTRPPSIYTTATTARRAPPPPPPHPATAPSTAFSSSSEELLEAASSPTTTTRTATTAATTISADTRSAYSITVLPLQGPRLTTTHIRRCSSTSTSTSTPMSSRHTTTTTTQHPPHPGSYLSTTPSSTTRSNTPIKLPLQMTAPTAAPTTTSTPTPRSWLGDPDDVPLDDLRTPKHHHRAQVLVPQQASQVTISTPGLPPPNATTLPAVGDEESRPGSRDSEWNSTHPCYPHRNPYVPLDSALYRTTRIIRISRDFMVYGDLAPAYSNVFPDILEPHVTEEQFRVVVARVNEEMRRAFDPWSVWNWSLQARVAGVEAYLEGWNRELERLGQRAVFIPLRRTGYMNLDIQIPDPIPDPAATDEDDTESKFVDEDASETGSTIGPLGSEAGHHSLRMNSMNGRGGGRMGSLGSGDYSNDAGSYGR